MINSSKVFGQLVVVAYSKAATDEANRRWNINGFAANPLAARIKITNAYTNSTDPLHKEIKKKIDEMIN